MKQINPQKKARIIALQLISRGFGYAVMEGNKQIIDWGVVELHAKYTTEKALAALKNLDRYHPDVIVVPAISEISDKRTRVRKFLKEVCILGSPRVSQISNLALSRAFRECTNKYDRARRICSVFPFLSRFLPRQRLNYMSEDYRMPLFDAIARGMAYYHL
jgi:hypothetical protein